MPKRRWETYRKNIEKTPKKYEEMELKLMKIDETSTSEWTSPPRWKTHLRSMNFYQNFELSHFENIWKTRGIYRCFWVSAFSFRRTGANKNIQKTMPKSLKNMFFHWKTISKSFKNRGRKKYQKNTEIWYQNGAKSDPKTIKINEKT